MKIKRTAPKTVETATSVVGSVEKKSLYFVSGEDLRKLTVIRSDIIAAKPSFDKVAEWYAAVNEIEDMMNGDIPVVLPSRFVQVDIPSGDGQKTFVAHFVASAKNMRMAKFALMVNFDMFHLPQGKHIDHSNGLLSFRVNDCTRQQCSVIFEANTHIFTSFQVHDIERENTGRSVNPDGTEKKSYNFTDNKFTESSAFKSLDSEGQKKALELQAQFDAFMKTQNI